MSKLIAVLSQIVLLFFLVGCDRQIDKDLVSAAAEGDTARVGTLIARGANIEARANDDWTALTIAAARGRLETVRVLLEKKAKVNSKEGGGHTPLFWAERDNHKEVAELLKNAGGVNE